MLPLRAFPTTIDVLEIGATNISFKKPNSLSHTIENAEKSEVNRTIIPNIPG